MAFLDDKSLDGRIEKILASTVWLWLPVFAFFSLLNEVRIQRSERKKDIAED
jgi:hypothetical protein